MHTHVRRVPEHIINFALELFIQKGVGTYNVPIHSVNTEIFCNTTKALLAEFTYVLIYLNSVYVF